LLPERKQPGPVSHSREIFYFQLPIDQALLNLQAVKGTVEIGNRQLENGNAYVV